jgi:iron complex transport system permease protein
VTSRARSRALGVVAGLAALAVLAAASLALGSKPIPLATVADALTHYDRELEDHLIVHTVRIPRTVLGIVVGMALGAAGAIMQGLTRNPLADPGILGLDAGAGLLVVTGIGLLGITAVGGYIWLSFLGTAIAAAAVYTLGALGREGPTPVKLALAGAAVTILISSITSAILLLDRATWDQFRFWGVGALSGRDLDVALVVGPFIAIGLAMALACGRLLNAMTLGDDVARALGQGIGRARGFAAIAVVLLCGASTAAVGPIGFVGLMVPHLARLVTGPDFRWILPYSMLLGPVLLLGSDVLGRIVARPAEVQAGIVTALVGGVVFIALARRRALAEL